MSSEFRFISVKLCLTFALGSQGSGRHTLLCTKCGKVLVPQGGVQWELSQTLGPGDREETNIRTLRVYHPLMGAEALSRGTQTSHGDTVGTARTRQITSPIWPSPTLQSLPGDPNRLRPARSQRRESRQRSWQGPDSQTEQDGERWVFRVEAK